MNAILEWTTLFLNSSAFIYLAACFAFITAIAKVDAAKVRRWNWIASALVVIGFVLHTAGLLGRWYIGGISRPPWTNLYESLIFFAWGVVLFQVWAQQKWKLPLVGSVSIPLVFILMGMGVMTPNKAVEPLIPALQSHWLKIHVIFGMISYAGFTIAACFAYLYLMRRGVSLSKIAAGVALMILVNLGIAGGQEAFYDGGFYMAKTAVRTMPDGKEVRTKDTYREYEGGPVITRMEKVPYAAIPFWFSVFFFTASIPLLLLRRKKLNIEDAGEDLSPEQAHKQGYDIDFLSKSLFIAGLVAMFALFVVVGIAKSKSETLTLSSNPYLTMLLTMTFLYGAVFVLIQTRYQSFLKSMPSAGRLGELEYKNILFGFPFQTLLLITGAVWAYYAWGRSWGWDPKETWALITWFAYLIYLHGKLLLRWKGPLLSSIAIVSFVILVFAFLGVNLVLSGLHSYGAA